MWTRFIARNWSKESYSSGQHSYKGINSIYTSLGNECLFILQYFLYSNANLLWPTLIWLVTSISYFASFSQFIHFSAFPLWFFSTCSRRSFLFFVVWWHNNLIEEIKRGTKMTLLNFSALDFYWVSLLAKRVHRLTKIYLHFSQGDLKNK